jgi:signal transduction histidine kinase
VTCLLVDDLEENLLALSSLLEQDGVKVLTAKSGEEALELLLTHDVALALIDVQMPGMDGFELAELMRGPEKTRSIPIIFVTAGARDQHRLFKGYQAGGVDFIYKPIEPAVLRNKSSVFFALHRQKRLLARQLDERTRALHWNEMFTAVLGHDLRNPLAAILASAELIALVAKDDRSRSSADRIATSATRMSRMIDDLLDLARARLGGGIAICTSDMNLGTLVERIVQEQRAAMPHRAITLHLQNDLNGEWDPDRLEQVVSNLLGNALSHGVTEQPVEVRAHSPGAGWVQLSVFNSGHIAPDRIASLFDPYKGGQRHATSSGLGLGLYIVQQIAAAHGGSVEVKAVGNAKVEFTVLLPSRMDAAQKAANVIQTMPTDGAEGL